MATVSKLRLGPKDRGRVVAYADYRDAEFAPGYQYELIDGKLEMAALPRWPHGKMDIWLSGKLNSYALVRPDVINLVYNRVSVFVPGKPEATFPEPDIAAYRDFPLDRPDTEVDWDLVSPFLVVEILSPDNIEKDVVRNVKLYWQVPSIREYWIVDGLQGSDHPSLRIYRRAGKRWRIIDVAFGETYATKLLPGFELVVDPRQ